MPWQQLDFPTRAGVVAAVIAVLGVLLPPISVASGVVSAVFSGIGLRRASRSGQRNRTAQICLAVSVGLVVLIVVGNAIYAAID